MHSVYVECIAYTYMAYAYMAYTYMYSVGMYVCRVMALEGLLSVYICGVYVYVYCWHMRMQSVCVRRPFEACYSLTYVYACMAYTYMYSVGIYVFRVLA